MDNLIPIGRFSRMTRLTVKALRHYDRIGLLAPAVVDESSGYRYYSPGQANRAEAIRILRAVEMPLEEIREALEAANDEVTKKILENHRLRLAEQLSEQERMLAFLERLIKREGTVMPYEVTVKEVTDQGIASVTLETSLRTIAGDIQTGFGTLVGYLGSMGVQPSGAPFIIYHDIIDENTSGKIEICAPVSRALEGSDEVASDLLGGGPVASTIHTGPYQEIGPAYHTLTGWISEHGHEMAGPPREIYLNDPTQVPEEDLLTEVQWPIDPA